MRHAGVRRPYTAAPNRGCCSRGLLLPCVALLVIVFVAGNVVLFMRRSCEASLTTLQQRLAAADAGLTAALTELDDVRKAIAAAPPRALAPVPPPEVEPPSDPLNSPEKQQQLPPPPPPQSQSQPAVKQKPAAPTPIVVAAPPPASHHLEPASKDPSLARAVLIVCYNRAEYLDRTLGAIFARMPSYNRPHIYVSQDGDSGPVSSMITDWASRFKAKHPDVPFTHWRHPGGEVNLRGAAGWALGYYKLSQHFGWALNRLFGEVGHPRVIIIEDDLEVAVDFFDYFTATENILDGDDSLLAVSGWSDVGQAAFVSDATAVLRTDFFPGLGWMLNKHAWEELGPKWPVAFWDDWLRLPAQRAGRAFLRPEVSRTFTFGRSGTSNAQFFDEFLATIKLNDVPVDWGAQDLSYLHKGTYDATLAEAVAAAKTLGTHEAVGAACGDKLQLGTAVKTTYTTLDEFKATAEAFGFISDEKAGVPRTSYEGVVTLSHKGCRKYIVNATRWGR